MRYLYYSLLFTGLYVYLGLGLTLLIAPRELKRYGLLLAPLVGYCYVTLVGWYCFVSGLPGTDAYATAVCLPPLGFLLIALARQGRNVGEIRALINKDAGMAFALGLAAFLAISVPSMVSPFGLTAMSLGNADVIHYSTAARYLKSFSIGADTGFLGQIPSITAGASDRFGTVLATALPSSLFSLETYQLQNILTHVFFAFGVLLMVYLVGREVFGYGPSTAALGGLLVAANPLLGYTVFHYFEGQIISMALALGLVMLHVQAARAASVRDCLRGVPLAALMTWGVSVAYGHMLPLVIAAAAALALALALQRRSYATAGRWIGFCAVTLLITLACSADRAHQLVRQVLFFSDRTAGGGGAALGWPVPWLLPGGLFTIPDAFPWTGPLSAAPAEWALGAAFVLLLVWAFGSSYLADPERFSLIAGCSVIVLAGYAGMSLVDHSLPAGYSSYKWISFFLPLLLLCLVAPLAAGAGVRLRPSWWLCLAAIGVGSAFYSAREVALMVRTPWVVRPEMAALQAIEANPDVHSINIVGETRNTWDSMWKSNFLLRKTQYLEWGSYWAATKLVGDWDLDSVKPGRPSADDEILRVGTPGNGQDERIEVGSGYVLTKPHVQVEYGLGWHDREPTLRWTGNGWASGVLHLRTTGRPVPVSLAATYWPLNPSNRLSILLNHELLAECPASGSCVVPRADLRRGDNVLEFRSRLPPERPSHGDARLLGYAFTRIDIQPVP